MRAARLTVTNSYFHDNQDGILGGAVAGGVITIDRSEFDHNGAGDGPSHNIYVGKIATFQMTNSYSHDAVVGHEVKSRASQNIMSNNRLSITMARPATASICRTAVTTRSKTISSSRDCSRRIPPLSRTRKRVPRWRAQS
jgi:hypothetical protein